MNLTDLKAEFNAGMGHSLEVALQNIHDRITAEINAERDKLASDIAGVDVGALQAELVSVKEQLAVANETITALQKLAPDQPAQTPDQPAQTPTESGTTTVS